MPMSVRGDRDELSELPHLFRAKLDEISAVD